MLVVENHTPLNNTMKMYLVVDNCTPLVVDDYTPKKEKRNKRIKDIKIYIRESQLHIQSMHKHSY